MVTYNDKILVPNATKDELDTIHPETNTGNVYDFKNNKWLNELLSVASTTELGLVKIDGTTIKVNEVTGAIRAEIPIIQDATTTQKGIVRLSDSIIDSSITTAPTANAVKMVNDKFVLPESIPVVLENGWSTSSDRMFRYYKDAFGIVHLSGRIIITAATEGIVGRLPVGYRPVVGTATNFIGNNDNEVKLATLSTDGRIVVNPNGMPLNVEIDVSFRTT